MLNKEPQTKPKIQIDAVRNETKATTIISGKAFTRHAFIKTGRLLLVHRESGNQVPVPIDWVYQNETSVKKFGLYRYHYTATIHWSQLYQAAQLQEGVYDAFVALDFYHRSEPKLHRLGRARYITRQLTPEALGKDDTSTMHIIPYYTTGRSPESIV